MLKTISRLIVGVFLFAGILIPKDASATDVPQAPSSVSASVISGNKVNVTWTSALNPHAYVVEKNTSNAGYIPLEDLKN